MKKSKNFHFIRKPLWLSKIRKISEEICPTSINDQILKDINDFTFQNVKEIKLIAKINVKEIGETQFEDFQKRAETLQIKQEICDDIDKLSDENYRVTQEFYEDIERYDEKNIALAETLDEDNTVKKMTVDFNSPQKIFEVSQELQINSTNQSDDNIYKIENTIKEKINLEKSKIGLIPNDNEDNFSESSQKNKLSEISEFTNNTKSIITSANQNENENSSKKKSETEQSLITKNMETLINQNSDSKDIEKLLANQTNEGQIQQDVIIEIDLAEKNQNKSLLNDPDISSYIYCTYCSVNCVSLENVWLRLCDDCLSNLDDIRGSAQILISDDSDLYELKDNIPRVGESYQAQIPEIISKKKEEENNILEKKKCIKINKVMKISEEEFDKLNEDCQEILGLKKVQLEKVYYILTIFDYDTDDCLNHLRNNQLAWKKFIKYLKV